MLVTCRSEIKTVITLYTEQSECFAKKEEQLWHLYRGLNAYHYNHSMIRNTKAFCSPVANEKSLNEVLDRIKRDIREMVRRRKVSSGTRHDDGRQCRDTFAS